MQEKLDVRAVFRSVFEIYVDRASVLMPAAAVVSVVSGILWDVLAAAGPGTALLGEILSVIAIMWFTGIVVELAARVQRGDSNASLGPLLQAVAPALGQLILLGVLYAVAIAVGLFLLVVPGLVMLTLWSVAAPVVVLERLSAGTALRRSRELVRGSGWEVFLVVLVFDVLVVVIAFAIAIVAASGGVGLEIVVESVIGVLAAPLSALASAVLYFKLLAVQPTPLERGN
jgi:hypothetical protein